MVMHVDTEKPKPIIMVVEDDGEVREALCDLLQSHGFAVRAAENGEQALSELRAHPEVRAIVLDVVMPVMNGATFRGEQLADPTIASIPLILLTGRDDVGPIASALSATARLQKPVVGEELLRILERYR